MDLTGKTFKNIYVIGRNAKSVPYRQGGKEKVYDCKCLICGKIFTKRSSGIIRSTIGNCGCIKSVYDLTGQRFGRLTVLKRQGTSHSEIQWLCKCDCGNIYTALSYALRKGITTNCGCVQKEKWEELAKRRKDLLANLPSSISAETKQHLLKKSPLYYKWTNLKTRCYNPKYSMYKNYGGKGIKVCDAWMGENGFINFYNWAMKNGYKKGLTIDRINNEDGYNPKNCRLVDMRTQQNNRTNNRILEYNGKKDTMANWSRKLNLRYGKIQKGLAKGKTLEEIYEKDKQDKLKKLLQE